ncbi:hypothetical protein [Bradyrhizobium canariense]|uniref:hypothetical protein n=1 Tax=Bradyrhizobium canariense TaxID=255045 RepID=UPI00143228DA|nr:hypothetical protein [Bradyrhizobium canariense]
MRSAIFCRHRMRRPEKETGARSDHGVVSLGGLSIRALLCDFVDVNRQITIRRLLAIFMIAGLALAPFSRPVMAGMTSDPAMADDMSASAMPDEMANDMPCCPSKAPAPIGCDKCVFMAACAAKCFTGLTAAVFQPLFAVSAGLARPRNDFWLDGLGHSPPEYPPRTLV